MLSDRLTDLVDCDKVGLPDNEADVLEGVSEREGDAVDACEMEKVGEFELEIGIDSEGVGQRVADMEGEQLWDNVNKKDAVAVTVDFDCEVVRVAVCEDVVQKEELVDVDGVNDDVEKSDNVSEPVLE